MTITSISTDDFHIEILRSRSRCQQKAKICVKEIDSENTNAIKQNVTFRKGENISGADVPSAMMVNPTTKSLIPSFLAILDDDSTNLSEPNTRVIIDNTSSEIFKNTFILYRLNL